MRIYNTTLIIFGSFAKNPYGFSTDPLTSIEFTQGFCVFAKNS